LVPKIHSRPHIKNRYCKSVSQNYDITINEREKKSIFYFNFTVKDLEVDGRIILKLSFKKYDGGHGLDGCGSGYGHVTICCECGNEPSGSVKCRKFLD